MALNILVVDDSSIMRKMIIKGLRLSGLPLGELYEAGNGKEALQIIADEWIDVALVDINMPVMTGDELIDALRADPETAKFPIIVVSSESSEKRIELLKAKGTEFVHKPFTPESVREAIAELTGVTYEHASEAEDIQGSGLDF
jgi:two-component system chemotaxis response regulator CheY